MHPTADLVAVGVHWGNPKQGGFTHLWEGPGWGEGKLIPDPHPSWTISRRPWIEVRRLTDKTGATRIDTIQDHAAEGVRVGVRVLPEAKGPALLDLPEFWERLGDELDAVGHPRWMMTLSDIGSPLRRLAAAKGAGFKTAVLPRGTRPATLDTRWRPVTDAFWGTVWGPT